MHTVLHHTGNRNHIHRPCPDRALVKEVNMSSDHTLSCVMNNMASGDHAYCECPCHKTLPAVPPSRKRTHVVRGREIKNKLMDLRLVLINNTNKFDADYHISARGVPYVHVMVNGKRYQIAFFGKSQKFRLFPPNDSADKVDFVDEGSLILALKSIRKEDDHG